MHGNNPTERQDPADDGQTLDVIGIYSTLQGEGPLVGTPATFIRLAGCHLQCRFCDTEFIKGRSRWSCRQIMDQADVLENHLVVFTGGEPLRQNIIPTLYRLQRQGHRIQVETAGHFWWEEGNQLSFDIVVSPKTPVVHPDIGRRALAWKYIVGVNDILDPDDGLPNTSTQGAVAVTQRLARPPQGTRPANIFIQPCDHWNPTSNLMARRMCVDLCSKYGYRLSLQTHKVLGLP